MVKLEDVKVLDMKDGEVTRIEYDGEVYTKIDGGRSDIFRKSEQTERKPKPGDKIRIVNAHHVTRGKYKNGDILTVKKYIRGNEIINERVIVEEFEAPTVFLDEFEFVNESELKTTVNVGDFVKVSGNNNEHEERDVAGWGREGQGLVPFGTIGKVTEVKNEGVHVKFIEGTTGIDGDDINYEFYLEHGEYEPVTFYDKPAQIGDKILINEHAWGTQGKYAKGDVLTVKGVRTDGVVFVEENDRPISPFEFVIIERSGEIKSEIKTEKRPAKVGDKIRIVNAWFTDGKYENGDVLTVMRVDSDGGVWTTEELGGKFIAKSEYEVIIEEDNPQFKVGDFAKVVGETCWGDIKKGTIVKITDEADSVDDLRFETLNGDDYDYAKAESLEKVNLTDRELSFLRAGRNVGEYKKGDIAYVISKEDERIVGKLVEVLSEPIGTFDGGNVHVKFGDLKIIVLGDNLKLITPVESRTDIERSESDE